MSSPPDTEVDALVREFARRVGAHTALLMEWDRDRTMLLEVASWGRLRGELVVEAGRDGGFVSRAADSIGPLIEPVAAGGAFGPSARGLEIAYGLAAPVRAAGPPIGVLCAGFEKSPPARPFAWWCAETFANLAALCLTDPGAIRRLAERTRTGAEQRPRRFSAGRPRAPR